MSHSRRRCEGEQQSEGGIVTRNEIMLNGCAPEPLIHYLKALGVFRLVAEKPDPSVRAMWRGDAFILECENNPDELTAFFLDDYCPTPIVNPWNNGSGFHASIEASGSGKKVMNFRNIKLSTHPRLQQYRDTIKQVEELLATCLTPEVASLNPTKRSEALKPLLIPLCRNNLPDETVRWLDAVCLLIDDADLRFPPLLGSAGNDGNLEFSLTFMGRLYDVLPTDSKARPDSRRQLEASLFGAAGAKGIEFSPGQFHPAGGGGVNATCGVEAKYLANPWDYILAVEGSLLFAGAAVRRMHAASRKAASFPFCVRRSDFGSFAAPGEENRGELFLPIWERPACFAEINHLFTEGRVRLGSRQAQDTVDFARAIAELGVDRGITRFQRYAIFTRNGNMQYATSLGSIEVPKQSRPNAELIYDIESERWLSALREASNKDKTPPRFARVRASIEESLFNLSVSGQREDLLSTLVALGDAESELARGIGFCKKQGLRPLLGLHERWANKCDDGSNEFEIAAALASISGEGKRGQFRAHLEPVDVSGSKPDWTNDETGVVWGAGTLTDNLAAVLHRRSIDARSAGASHPALSGKRNASLAAVDGFLRGLTDDARLEEMLRGLILINWTTSGERQARHSSYWPSTLPRAYALLKLLFLSHGRFEIKGQSEPIIIRHEPSIVPLLRAGRIDEALEIASRRLRSSGLVRMTNQFYFPAREGPRLAASLLIPIDARAINALAALVVRPSEADNND
jgi:CRISPR-associated protein Csx17